MADQITLVLADSNESASLVADKYKLKNEDYVVISKSSWLEATELRPPETIYMTSTCPIRVQQGLLDKINNDLNYGETINLIVLKT